MAPQGRSSNKIRLVAKCMLGITAVSSLTRTALLAKADGGKVVPANKVFTNGKEIEGRIPDFNNEDAQNEEFLNQISHIDGGENIEAIFAEAGEENTPNVPVEAEGYKPSGSYVVVDCALDANGRSPHGSTEYEEPKVPEYDEPKVPEYEEPKEIEYEAPKVPEYEEPKETEYETSKVTEDIPEVETQEGTLQQTGDEEAQSEVVPVTKDLPGRKAYTDADIDELIDHHIDFGFWTKYFRRSKRENMRNTIMKLRREEMRQEIDRFSSLLVELPEDVAQLAIQYPTLKHVPKDITQIIDDAIAMENTRKTLGSITRHLAHRVKHYATLAEIPQELSEAVIWYVANHKYNGLLEKIPRRVARDLVQYEKYEDAPIETRKKVEEQLKKDHIDIYPFTVSGTA